MYRNKRIENDSHIFGRLMTLSLSKREVTERIGEILKGIDQETGNTVASDSYWNNPDFFYRNAKMTARWQRGLEVLRPNMEDRKARDRKDEIGRILDQMDSTLRGGIAGPEPLYWSDMRDVLLKVRKARINRSFVGRMDDLIAKVRDKCLRECFYEGTN